MKEFEILYPGKGLSVELTSCERRYFEVSIQGDYLNPPISDLTNPNTILNYTYIHTRFSLGKALQKSIHILDRRSDVKIPLRIELR